MGAGAEAPGGFLVRLGEGWGLVDGAVRFAPAGGPVTCGAGQRDDQKEALKHLFGATLSDFFGSIILLFLILKKADCVI